MNNGNVLKKCAVIGAAGKMGCGIAMLLLIDMASSEAREFGEIATGEYRLILVDANREGMEALKRYLRLHLQKHAERNINTLRDFFKNNSTLVSNREIIDYFVERGMDIVTCTSAIEAAVDIPIVFEAIVEDPKAKSELFKKITAMSKTSPYLFTNTSSIPISLLDAEAKLEGRIIGFHFYNPPAVQKLLEIIPTEGGDPNLYALAMEIGRRLDKKIVVAKDVAGFIGNSHFIREIALATALVKELSANYSISESIYMVNRMTGDFLLRPMGIFQLIDYVGLDIMQKVGGIINAGQPSLIYDDFLFKPLLDAGRLGGQHPDGLQKEGFFSYRSHAIAGIYNSSENRYSPLSQSPMQAQCDSLLGDLPAGYLPWSVLSRDPEKEIKIALYLKALAAGKTMGCRLAYAFLLQSQLIIDELVDNHVAASREDVETVLKNGFYHLYASL